jgi:undecaprenyl-diphosphatase
VHETLYHLIGTYGYLFVFLLVGIESFGIPLPGETALITASAFAALGRLEFFGVLAASAAGAILGDNAGYWVGHKGGIAVIRRYGKYLRLDAAKIDRMHMFFDKHGAKTVFIGRFISLLRCWAAALAGVARMPYGTFMFWNALGGITWSAIFATLGYYFGRNLPLLERYVGQASMAAALLVALVVVFALLARWFTGHRATVAERVSEKWRTAATDPRLARFRSEHRRLWGYVAARFARGEYLVIHLTIGFAVSVVALWLFALVTEDILHHDPLTRFDVALASWLLKHESPVAHGIFHDLSLAGSPLVMAVMALVVAVVLAFKREWIIFSGWLAAFYGGSLLAKILEALVRRPRLQGTPLLVDTDTLRLPTGHAFGSLVGYGLLTYLVVVFLVKQRVWRAIVVGVGAAAILAISFSRLYLGVLYFSDIVGVYAAGVVWLATCISGIEIARGEHRPTLAEVGLDGVSPQLTETADRA